MITLADWRKKYKRHVAIISIIVACIGIVALIFAGYWFDWAWTGFNPSIGPQVQQYQSGKTLWDWIQLFIIPVGLALFAFWYNHKEQKATLQRAKTESDRALEFQRQTTLQAYIDRMSDLLLDTDIDTLKQDGRFLAVARARTLTALIASDAGRKTSVFEFLYSIGLLGVIYLGEADLSGASMNGANLREVKMRKANLSGADLSDAILDRANLNAANLVGAIYTKEQLSKAGTQEKIIL